VQECGAVVPAVRLVGVGLELKTVVARVLQLIASKCSFS
jgi:hypothetical protein